MGQVQKRSTDDTIVRMVLRDSDCEVSREDIARTALRLLREEVRDDIANCVWKCAVHEQPSLSNDCTECIDALDMNVIVNMVLGVESLKL